MLTDRFGTKIDYLRISVTDRCNLRCVYCMPEAGIDHKSHEEVLTFEEIARIAGIFASLGIRRIRLTGGEALARKNIIRLIEELSRIENIGDLSLTTNGVLLPLYADELRRAGIKRINISLDSLREDRFQKITLSNSLHKVLEGIDKAGSLGFDSLKINTVVMRGVNDDEIFDFIDFAFSKGLILRFIEFMKVTPLWKKDYFVPIEEVMRACGGRFRMDKIGRPGPGPAVYYKIKEKGTLGFIKTDADNCKNCGRLRLTSTGELKTCLYETGGISLRGFLRRGLSDEEIKNIILRHAAMKPYVDYRTYEPSQSYMCSIGG